MARKEAKSSMKIIMLAVILSLTIIMLLVILWLHSTLSATYTPNKQMNEKYILDVIGFELVKASI